MGELMELAKKKAELERMQACFNPYNGFLTDEDGARALADLSGPDGLSDREIDSALVDFLASVHERDEAAALVLRAASKLRKMVMGEGD